MQQLLELIGLSSEEVTKLFVAADLNKEPQVEKEYGKLVRLIDIDWVDSLCLRNKGLQVDCGKLIGGLLTIGVFVDLAHEFVAGCILLKRFVFGLLTA